MIEICLRLSPAVRGASSYLMINNLLIRNVSQWPVNQGY